MPQKVAAKRNKTVALAVLRRVRTDPKITNADLKEMAAKIDPSVRKLTPHQFHGRYGLAARVAVKREASPKAAGRPKTARTRQSVTRASNGAAKAADGSIGVVQVAMTALVSRALRANSKEEVVALYDEIPTVAQNTARQIRS